ncbi:polysaccharide deacetylase family protein [Streptomyces sp. NPDC047108]|uniref:polysaccharide deacetylase family protein n=1 Tax=Streptomyces sp. NPDC047108 TaxID=3155025 RepID=UPI0033D12083
MARTLPVFCYHSVSDDPPAWIAPYTVTPRDFARQLRLIRAGGRTVIPLRQLVSALRGGPPVPERAAVITFDDGYADFATAAAPLLARHDAPASVFVTTGAVLPHVTTRSFLPPADMLSARQIRELDQADFDIGAHSRTHPHLEAVTPDVALREIAESKRELEDILGHTVPHFAYPRGSSSRAVRRAVREAGFSAACAVGNVLSSDRDDPVRIRRLLVQSTTSDQQFRSWVQERSTCRPLRGVQELALRTVRRNRPGIKKT